MLSVLDTPVALVLLTHPFQVVLIVVTAGALVRQGIRAWIVGQAHVIDTTAIIDINLRKAA